MSQGDQRKPGVFRPRLDALGFIGDAKLNSWDRDTLLAAYDGNRQSGNDVALEASSVARPPLELLDENGEWSGTSSELLTELQGRVSDQLKQQDA